MFEYAKDLTKESEDLCLQAYQDSGGVYDISMASGFYSLEEVTFLSDREYMDSVYFSAILSSSDYTICTDYHYGEFMLAMRMEYVKNMLP